MRRLKDVLKEAKSILSEKRISTTTKTGKATIDRFSPGSIDVEFLANKPAPGIDDIKIQTYIVKSGGTWDDQYTNVFIWKEGDSEDTPSIKDKRFNMKVGKTFSTQARFGRAFTAELSNWLDDLGKELVKKYK